MVSFPSASCESTSAVSSMYTIYSLRRLTVFWIETPSSPISFSLVICRFTSRFPAASCCAVSFNSRIGWVRRAALFRMRSAISTMPAANSTISPRIMTYNMAWYSERGRLLNTTYPVSPAYARYPYLVTPSALYLKKLSFWLENASITFWEMSWSLIFVCIRSFCGW